MTTLALNVFKGMWPRQSRQQLPPDGSELAVNCSLLSGDLRALRQPRKAVISADLTGSKVAFRIPAAFREDILDPSSASVPSPDDIWVGFAAEFSHFLKGPLVNDSYNRWYWTEEGQPPRYNTLERIIAGDPPYRLGVPRPENFPLVEAVGYTKPGRDPAAEGYDLWTDPSSAAPIGGTDIPITVNVFRDGAPLDAVSITAVSADPALVTVAPASADTDADGVASFTITAAGTPDTEATVVVTFEDAAEGVTYEMPVVVGAYQGNNDLQETRCYVYTFVTVYGEEGPPSEPTCAEGNSDGDWIISNMDTVPPAPWDTEGAPVVKKRIYRTVTGETGGSFFFVDEIPVGQSYYHDTVPTDDVSLNTQLDSDAWIPPPDNLIGILRHPNGFLVGFTNDPNDLYFSVPYRPHAWPAEYTLSTEGMIQNLGVFGTSIAVLTNAHPYTASGTNPAGISLTKSNTVAPCVSRYSVVSTEMGVLYAAISGITAVSPGGIERVTDKLINKGEWRDRYDPRVLRSSRIGFSYIGIAMHADKTQERIGLAFSPDESNSVWSEISFLNQQKFESLQTDIYSGDLYTIIADAVYWIGLSTAFPEQYQWRSTEFVTPRPINFGAYRIDFDVNINYPEQAPLEGDNSLEAKYEWNQARIALPLDTFDLYAISGVRQETLAPPNDTIVQNRQALGGSPLYDIVNASASTVSVTLWGDRQVRYQRTLSKPGIYRLPEGYKTDLWQLEFSGNADLHHFKMAETGKELARV